MNDIVIQKCFLSHPLNLSDELISLIIKNNDTVSLNDVENIRIVKLK
jgi:hypothetical protein